MSGGSKAPKAPDVSTNIQRANDQFDTETGRAGQVWNTAQGYNQNAQDFLGRIVGQTSPVMDEINQSSRANLSSYGRNFLPLQEQQAQDALAMSSPDQIARQRAQAMGDVAAANAAAKRNSVRALTNAGVDPNSIQGQALDRQANVVGAGNVAAAGTRATQQAQEAGRNAVAGANQLGLQVGALGQQGGATGAGIGTNLVQATNATNNAGVNNLLAPSTYSNLAMNANAGAANIGSQNYQDRLAGHAQNQQGLGDIIGNVGSLVGGIAALADGGVVPSEGALPSSPIPGSTDTKPAFLTPGEFVIPEGVVRYKGEEFFHKLIDSSRLKANERKAEPEAVYAHKTAPKSVGGAVQGHMEGGPIGYMSGGAVAPSAAVLPTLSNVGVGNAGVLANSGAIKAPAPTWQDRARAVAAQITQQPAMPAQPTYQLERAPAIPLNAVPVGYNPQQAAA